MLSSWISLYSSCSIKIIVSINPRAPLQKQILEIPLPLLSRTSVVCSRNVKQTVRLMNIDYLDNIGQELLGLYFEERGWLKDIV